MPERRSDSRRDGIRPCLMAIVAAAEGMFSSLSSLFRIVATLTHYLWRELRLWEEYPLPLGKRLRAWRHGFMSRNYLLFDLDDEDPDDYLSARQQARYISPAVNGTYADVLENKVAYHLSTEPYVDCVPTFYGVIQGGEFVPGPAGEIEGGVSSILDAEGDVIIKPVTGTHGRGVYRLSREPGGYTINGDRVSEEGLADFLRRLDGFLAVEFVENHGYADAICPTAVNTIRVIAIRGPDSHEFSVVSAVHRFGSSTTGPTDNWSGGGFAAPIDVETGEFGHLIGYTPETGLRRLERHPDTGTRVNGEYVPQWERIKATVLDVAELHREEPYVGWDVVLTDDGPVVLEGNCAPGITVQQLGSGLLENDRVREFVESLDSQSELAQL